MGLENRQVSFSHLETIEEDSSRTPACLIQGHEVAICDIRSDEAQKLYLPEQICTNALARLVTQAKLANTRRQRVSSPRYAHAIIEQAFSVAAVSTFQASLFMQEAEEAVQQAANIDLPDKLRLENEVLQAYLPAFKRRALGATVTPRDIAIVHQNLGELLADYPQSYRTPQAVANTSGIAAQIEIGTYLTRLKDPEYFPWPASYREEENVPHQLNHDMYLMRDKSKLPMQIKSSSKIADTTVYDSSICVIAHDTLGYDSIAYQPAIVDLAEPEADHYESFDQGTRPHHRFRSQHPTSSAGQTAPFKPSQYAHELTNALVCEATEGYVPDVAFPHIERITRFLRGRVDLFDLTREHA